MKTNRNKLLKANRNKLMKTNEAKYLLFVLPSLWTINLATQ